MSKSTPLNSLPRVEENEQQAVQEVLDGYSEGTNNDALPVQQQPMENPPPVAPMEQMSPMTGNQYGNSNNKPIRSILKRKKPSLQESVMKEGKLPLLVALIFIIFSHSKIDELLLTNVKHFMTQSGGMNIYGIIFKALLVGVSYYVIKKFVM